MDIDPLQRLRVAAVARENAGLHRRLRPRGPDHDGLLDLGSNDYLSLSRDPRLIEAAVRAVREWGTGAAGSRLVTGSTDLHAELDGRLAEFAGTESALVFSSGYLANLSAITTLAGAGSLVVSERLNHASLIDGCRLTRARVAVTPHRDVAAVERALADRDEENAIVVTDAVFSVDGDLAPLRELHSVVRRHRALLVVDEAHALGVIGDHGRGAAHAAGLAAERDVIRTFALSKAIGSQGGALVGAREIIDAAVDTGRSFIFDTGLAPAAVGAALAALEVLRTEPGLPARARGHAVRIAALAAGLGMETTTPAAAVVPVVIGAPGDAVQAAEICAECGVRVGCFRPPSVPAGRACLRLTTPAGLSEADITVVAKALAAVVDQVAPYPAGNTGRTGGER